jgi:hypothetical protein
MKRDLTPIVKAAVKKLFPDDHFEVEERLVRASCFERAHQGILAFSFGDRAKLEELCIRCEDDVSGERNIYHMEDEPEEYMTHIMRKDDAAAELARRYELLEFPEPSRFSRWGQYSKNWKQAWSNPSVE